MWQSWDQKSGLSNNKAPAFDYYTVLLHNPKNNTGMNGWVPAIESAKINRPYNPEEN